jgi:rod shape determining protein RodA
MKAALKRWRHADYILLLVLLMLLAYGLMMVYSASFPTKDTTEIVFSTFATRQLIFAVAGLLLMAFVASTDYRILRAAAYPIYLGALLLLCLVFFTGHGQSDYGSQRWIDLGFFPLQPSELAKLALILALARYFSDYRENIGAFRHFLGSALLTAPVIGLVYLQPDLGTSISYVAIWFLMSVAAGIHFGYLGLTVAGGLAAIPIVWSMLREYMRDRITIFLHPESDPWGEGYNIIQAQISIGAGGMFGAGLLAGTQTQGHFLRIQHSDFIFSVLAEEMGFVGALLLFALYFVLLMRLLRVASQTRDTFGQMVGVGVAMMFLFAIAVNVAANVRLLPVTGIPLPFISYGGSSLLTNLLCIGIVQSILMRRKRFLRA